MVRQYKVSPLARLPFSYSLLTGEPPPQKPKYAHSRSHCRMPRAIAFQTLSLIQSDAADD
jgi:hypothetical protein